MVNPSLDLQPQSPPSWMQMQAMPPMPQKHPTGFGDLASALTGTGIKALRQKGNHPPKNIYDSPMPKPDAGSTMNLLGALGGLA